MDSVMMKQLFHRVSETSYSVANNQKHCAMIAGEDGVSSFEDRRNKAK